MKKASRKARKGTGVASAARYLAAILFATLLLSYTAMGSPSSSGSISLSASATSSTSSTTASFAVSTVLCYQDYCALALTSCPASCPIRTFDFHNGCAEYFCATATAGTYAQPAVAGAPQPATLTYQILQNPTSVPLFEIYKQVVYDSPITLMINSNNFFAQGAQFPAGYTGRLTGYQHLTYVFTDRLGNSVFLPIDADIANTVSVKLNIDTSVWQANANQTSITINGLAGTYSNFGTQFTPLTYNDIYLYYNNNLDFVQYVPYGSTSDRTNAIFCAFSNTMLQSTQQITCSPYNPVWPSNAVSYNLVTYATSYNGVSSPVECNPPAPSLLQTSFTKCNIYNNEQLAQTCPNTGVLSYCQAQYDAGLPLPTNLDTCLQHNDFYYCSKLATFASYGTCVNTYVPGDPLLNKPQYCMPIYVNGTGECTSQLGLIGRVRTDASGSFKKTITACGSKAGESITAVYYGYPAPEPVAVNMTPLGLAANNLYPFAVGTPITVNELNYSQAPASAKSVFGIGIFELSYDNLDLTFMLVCIGTAIGLLLRNRK